MAKSPLPTLMRLAKMQLDERRKLLNALYTQDDALKAQITALEQHMAQEANSAHNISEGGMTHGFFIQASLKKIEQIGAQRHALSAEIAAAQEALRIAFEELKRYEIADNLRLERQDAARKHKETIMMDEVGSMRAQRQQEEE